MSSFYTNVQVYGNHILYRGIENGKRIQERFGFSPSLYVPSQSEHSPYRTIKDHPLDKIEFDSIKKAKAFLKDVDETTTVYGMRRFEYAFIEENPPIDWNTDDILVARMDIEVESENGFPEPNTALERITLISFKLNDHIHVFGTGEYDNKRTDTTYHKATSEKHLFTLFMAFWQKNYPDILTGWNCQGYDVPYLYNRLVNVMGEAFANRLSPWGVVRKSLYRMNSLYIDTYTILGIAVLDSMEMYKKYCPHGMSQDSHSLNNIGYVEKLGQKIDYSEVGSLHLLYKTNFQKYVDYNIQDILLDEKISNKYDVINLVLTVAYMNNVNIEDVFTQVRMWAAIVDREYKKIGILLDHGKKHEKQPFEGGYVKQPVAGNYKDVVSFDATALYPSAIMQLNASPETLITPEVLEQNDSKSAKYLYSIMKGDGYIDGLTIENVMQKNIDEKILKACYELNYSIAPNGYLYDKSRKGIFPFMADKLLKLRKENKVKQLECEKLSEKTDNVIEKNEYLKKAKIYKSLQMAQKICANSLYGASSSEFFVLFDLRVASGITAMGRLAIQWAAQHTNKYIQKITRLDHDFVIGIDTDSQILNLETLVKLSFGDKKPSIKERIDFLDKIGSGPIQNMLNNCFEDLKNYLNAYEQKMFMKREAIATTAFWTGKKRYAMAVWDMEGVRYHRPHIKITGLESVRSTTPPKARKALKTLIQIVLTRDKEYAINFIERFHDKFNQYDLQDIAVTTGVNGLDTYAIEGGQFRSGTPMHVRAALVYNSYIQRMGLDRKYSTIKNGNKIRYLFLKQPNPVLNDVFAWESAIPEELEIRKYIDYEALYNRTFKKPAETIMNSFGWSAERRFTLADLMQ